MYQKDDRFRLKLMIILRFDRFSFFLFFFPSPPFKKNAIDLDQLAIENELAADTAQSLNQAFNIYSRGAFSGSEATITISPGLTVGAKKGMPVTGFSPTRIYQVTGTLNNAYPATTNVLKILYDISAVQDNYVGCQVGANPTPNTERCKLFGHLVALHSNDTS